MDQKQQWEDQKKQKQQWIGSNNGKVKEAKETMDQKQQWEGKETKETMDQKQQWENQRDERNNGSEATIGR